MDKPDFLIIGAARCGTTALGRYLAEHPRVYLFAGGESEPCYFSRDLFAARFVTGEYAPDDEEYLRRHFGARREEHLAAGEKSVFYLYSAAAAERIRAFAPEAKLIVLLRDPALMVPSYHSILLYISEEDQADFAAAWARQDARGEGRELPAANTEPRLLQYRAVGKFGEQLQRYYRVFPREQILPLLFDDFVVDTPGVYRRVLEFLGVPADGRTEFPPVNEGRQVRNRFLGNMINRQPSWLMSAYMKARSRLGLGGLGLRQRLMTWNSRQAKRPPLAPELKRELNAAFRDDVGLLGELLKRDLGHWLADPAPAAAGPGR